MFPQAILLVQKLEYEWPGPNNAPRFKPEHPVTKLEGDRDVFGDGSVTIVSTPGHANTSPEQTRASMHRIADILAKEKATLWINHDKAQRDTLKLAPEYYE